VLDRRERMIEIRHRLETAAPVDAADREWLAALAERYGVEDGDLDELARRVDAVPPSLAIAQAALETGWGTSRAAQRAQNVFGHMAYGGGAPTKPFASLGDAVESYTHNLNIHRAYAGFREQRAKMRADGQVPDGFELARELTRYSERRADYVRDLRGLIRANNLRPFDRARLDG
jgi:Bax protein